MRVFWVVGGRPVWIYDHMRRESVDIADHAGELVSGVVFADHAHQINFGLQID